MTDTNSDLYVVPSPTHPHFAAINDINGANIMLTLNGTPVMPTEQAMLIVELLNGKEKHQLDPELALEVATENYRTWLEEQATK